MSWDKFVVVTDSDLARFEPEATNADMPWGQASWPTQIEQAKRTLRHWVDGDNPQFLGASDRLRDRYVFEHVKGFTSSAFTDLDNEAADPSEEDLNLATIFGTPASDAIYFGAPFTYSGIFVHMLDSVSATVSTLTASYWAKNQWQTVPSQSDGTAVSSATFGQSGRVTWSRIKDWERRTLDGSDEHFYWTRFMVSTTPTAGTTATQLLAIRHPEGLRTVAAWLSLGYIMRGLAAQSGDPEEWRLRADGYMEDARQLYDQLKLTGQIPLDVDLSGAVDQTEVGESTLIALGRMPRA